jgi:hypothetical protein
MSTFGILFYLLLGGLTFFAYAKIISFTKSRKAEKRFLVLLYLSVLLMGFGLAWCYTSFLENEPYAAYMGLVVFSGLGLVLGALGVMKVMPPQKAMADQEHAGGQLEMSWKKGVAVVLLVVFTLTFPLTWLFKSATGIFSDRDRVSTFLYERLLSDRAMPGAIKKALEYEAWLTRIDDPLEPRLIKAAVSGIEPAGMIELFDYVAPEKERKALLDEAAASFYSWIEGDGAYPSLTIQTGKYIKNIEDNSENLLLWIFKSFPIPACNPAQIEALEQGDHGNELKNLMLCKPPESLQVEIAPVGAALLKAQLAEKNPPATVNIAERMKNKIPAEKISLVKKRIRTLFFLGSTLWTAPVVLLLIGLLLAARSLRSAITWLSWPLTITGAVGAIIASRLPGLSFLHSVPKDVPEHIPGAVVGIGRKLGMDLADMLENAMFIPFLVLALAGGLTLLVAYRKKITLLAGRTRFSLGMVFGKQPV